MFGSAKAAARQQDYGKVDTVIGEETRLKGEIQSQGVVRVDGIVEGKIEHNGLLIVGPAGRLLANVMSKGLAVAGEVRGDVEVEGKLELLAGARMFGDIRCGHLVVHEGATFQGHSSMLQTGAANKEDADRVGGQA